MLVSLLSLQHLSRMLRLTYQSLAEAYFQPLPHLPAPLTSRNLTAFTSPHNSPWMRTFLSAPFFPKPNEKYGQPQPLFDALQVVLSHLLLSPSSRMAHVVNSSTNNYDMAIVYAWKRPFATLYSREPEPKIDIPNLGAPSVGKRMARKLRLRRDPPKVPRPEYKLDLHALLHIRNFWHHHLIDDSQGFISTERSSHQGPSMYAKMARNLMKAGITPKEWDRPLRNGPLKIASEWFGHYSRMKSWPNNLEALEANQSDAEDWKSIDPLVSR